MGPKGPSVQVVVSQMELALGSAAASLKDKGLKITEATVTLQTQTDTTKKFEATVFVVSASQSSQSTASSQVAIKFVEPTAPPSGNVSVSEDLYGALVYTIASAAQAFADAQAASNGKALPARAMSAEIAFTIKDSGTGGIKFEVPKALSIGPSLSAERSASHKIALTFARLQ